VRTALALLVFLGSSAPGFRVVVPSDLTCPSAPDVERELRSLPGSGAALPAGYVLRVARAGDLISVSLEDERHAIRGARNVRSTANCLEIARTISLLVHAWTEGVTLSPAPDAGVAARSTRPTESQRLTQPAREPPESAAAPVAMGDAFPDAGPLRAEPTLDGRASLNVANKPLSVSTSPATLAAASELISSDELDAGAVGPPTDAGVELSAGSGLDAGEIPAPGTALAAAAPPSPTWSAAALCGLDPTSGQVIATGLVRFERVIHGVWGIGAEVHADSPRTRELAPGRVSLWTASLGLAARRTLFFLGDGSAELIAAAAAEVLSASATGFTSNHGAVLAGFRASLSAEWNQPIAWGLSARAWVRVDARPWAESLDVDNVGQVLILPAVGGSAGLGVGWSF
jgi:hypothetical protein